MKLPKLRGRERQEELQGGKRRRRRRIAGQLARCPRRAEVCVAVSENGIVLQYWNETASGVVWVQIIVNE